MFSESLPLTEKSNLQELKVAILKELGLQAILDSPLEDKKIQAQIKRFCKNLVMKEDGLLWDSEVSGAESTLLIHGPIFGTNARIAYWPNPESLEHINRMLLVSALFKPDYHLFERVRRGRFNWFNFESSWGMEDALAEMKKINAFHKSADFKRLSSCCSKLKKKRFLCVFGGDMQSTMVSTWTSGIYVQRFSENWGVIVRVVNGHGGFDSGFYNDREVIAGLELYVDDDASPSQAKGGHPTKLELREEFFGGGYDFDEADYSGFSIYGFISIPKLESLKGNEFIEKIETFSDLAFYA